MRIFRDLLILLVLFGLVWYAFSLWSEPVVQDDFISVEQEEEIAETIQSFILSEFEISSDTSFNTLLDTVRRRLLKGLDTPQYDYSFTLLEGEEINAFCAFSGEIYVFKGLIEECEKPEELAAVLAHEIGHGQKRHVVKNLIRELGITTLTVIISGGDPVIIEQVAKAVISSSFSRKMEYEADDFAFDLLQNANINPQHLTAFFISLQSKKDHFIPEWLSTHPALDKRIERLAAKEKNKDYLEVPVDFKMAPDSI